MKTKRLIENDAVRPPKKMELTDPLDAYLYARHVLKGPFPAGEPVIATIPSYAYYYSMNVLNGPFPAGEPAIAMDADYAFFYARSVLKGVFPLAHKKLLSSVHADRYEALVRQDPAGTEYMKNVYMDYSFGDED